MRFVLFGDTSARHREIELKFHVAFVVLAESAWRCHVGLQNTMDLICLCLGIELEGGPATVVWVLTEVKNVGNVICSGRAKFAHLNLDVSVRRQDCEGDIFL